MSFFNIGELYRDTYHIEHVEPFFEGELAVASAEGKRYFLQHVRLQKPAPPRAIQQYLSLKNHPLIVPYLQVFSEERSLVTIRPYVPFKERLHQRVARGELEEDQIIAWVRSLFPVEKVLKEKPLRMYTLLHPANIGVTETGELQVLYCGVEGRTLPDPKMDWGNLLYMLFSGNLVDEPLKKLPSEADFPKQLAKLIQKSFNRPAESVASQLDSYLKKRDSTSLFDQLFKRSGSAKKEPDSTPSPSAAESDRSSQTEGSSLLQQRLEQERQAREEQERQEREEAERRRREEEAARQEQERQAREEQERQEREEAERRRREEEAAHREQERQAPNEQERRARAEEERQQHDRIAVQMEEYVRQVFQTSPGGK